ncbi:MAG: FG-GAP repeat protein [Phycisphaerales bacterium]|nr:FG-GAP repeat protein [Phycisphaerales bacterium]
MPRSSLLGVVVLISLLRSFASAQIDPVQMLHSAPTTTDSLGTSIDVDRDTMIVGAYTYDPAGKIDAGAAVIFRWAGSSWTEEARLVAGDGVAGDRFGRSVAVQGNTAVVGAYLAGLPGKSGAGAVYVFQRTGTTWTQVAKLTASDSAANDNFGTCVDLDGDTIVVGAPFKNGAITGLQAGAAYVYTKSAGVWSLQQKITDLNGSAGDQFGSSVALQGDTAVFGAPLDDVFFADRGSAQIFTRSAGIWTKRATLSPSDGTAFDTFGRSVAISNGTVAVGSPQNDLTTNGNQGAIYVYTGSGASWTQQQKLTRTGPLVNDFFPTSLAIEGDTIVAGLQTYDGIVGSNQGAGLFFTRSAGVWSASELFQPSETQAGALFGASVGISDQFVVTGSFSYNRPGATGAGAAYAFRRISGEPNRTLLIAPPTPQENANFGNRMANDGIRLVVGALAEDGAAGADQGAAYVYRFQDESFVLEQKLLPADPAAGANFGAALAIDGTTIIVGAPKDPQAGFGAGAAYVFTFNGVTWSQQAKLTASDGTALDAFGTSVAISGDRALIGAPNDNIPISLINQVSAGSACFFARSGSTWSQVSKVSLSAPSTNDFFGAAVAIEGDSALIGVPGYDTTGINNRGALFLYRWNGTAWANNGASSFTGTSDNDSLGSVISSRAGMFAAASVPGRRVICIEWNGSNLVTRGTLTAGPASFGSSVLVQSDCILVGMPNYAGGGAVYRFPRSGSTLSNPTLFLPGAVDASDNLGEAVGYAGGATFAGGGGISLPGGTNQGAFRRLQDSPRIDPFPINNSTGIRYASLASMFNAAGLKESLASELGPLARSGGFSFGNTEAKLNVPVVPFLSALHTITLADGSELSTSTSDMKLWNKLDVPSGANSRISAGTLNLDLPSTLNVGVGATLTITPPSPVFGGSATILPNATLSVGALNQNGTLTLLGGVVAATSVTNSAGAQFSGYGDIAAPVTNAGLFDIDANTQVIGNFTNQAGGTVTVFSGTLTVFGTLANSGTIIGSVAARSALSAASDPLGLYAPPFEDRATQTIFTTGGISMDAASTLTPSPGTIVRTAGSFDCAINLNSRYAMNQSTLQLNGRGGFTLEAMSTDRGQAVSALNPALAGSFPIGTLKIGPGNPSQPTIVTIVDNRDNDTLGQSACEAVYVNNLVIESGAVLNAPACRVYYKTITKRGTIATLPNVLRLYGPCPADLNSDGLVDDADFSIFVVQYDVLDCADAGMPSGCSADLNSDLLVDDQDFSIFVVAYDAVLCP